MKQDLAFFGFSPLLTGEDPAKYHELLQAIFDYVQPADIFERIWTREIADFGLGKASIPRTHGEPNERY